MSAPDPDTLVLLRTCADVQEALVLRSVLEGDGIDVFMPDEFTAPLHPAPMMAAGGVRLMVRAADLERARELLDTEAGEGPA